MFDVITGGKTFPEYSVVLLTKKSSGVYISIQSYSLLSAVCVEKIFTLLSFITQIHQLFHITNLQSNV